MRINKIEIKNFRGFAERCFNFDPKMNVVLGNNATGKTTLLHAVQIALGAYLQSLTLISKNLPQQFRRGFSQNDNVKVYNESNKTFLAIKEKPSIEIYTEFVEGIFKKNSKEYQSITTNVHWIRNGNTISQKNTGELMGIVEKLEDIRRSADSTGEISVLPLILTFGAKRLQNNYNGAQKTKARASREERAYKCALDEHVDFRSVFDWIYSFDRNMAKEMEFEGTDVAFFNAIKTGIPTIKQVYVNTKNEEFHAQIQATEDSELQWLTYDMMSDGFQAMINIVAEIAYRCIMLNGFLGIDAVKKTPGIVMIDEMDLYLHPLWQRHVLQDFQNAFPNIQFIVTTHSPFIVQSVDTKNVITLDSKLSPISPSNRGIEEIMSVEMGLDEDIANRSEKYRKKYELAGKYYQLIKDGQAGSIEVNDVKKALNDLELEAKMFDDPAFEAALRLKRGDL